MLDIARKNTAILGIEKKAKFAATDVFNFLEQSPNFLCNIVFADPPYGNFYGGSICNSIVKYNILQAQGILVLERSRKEEFESETLKLVRTLNFGQTEVDFYIREE
jgi:16S rRNA G966 N2-methylase RsmD